MLSWLVHWIPVHLIQFHFLSFFDRSKYPEKPTCSFFSIKNFFVRNFLSTKSFYRRSLRIVVVKNNCRSCSAALEARIEGAADSPTEEVQEKPLKGCFFLNRKLPWKPREHYSHQNSVIRQILVLCFYLRNKIHQPLKNCCTVFKCVSFLFNFFPSKITET